MPTTSRELLGRLRARSSRRPQHRAPRRVSRLALISVVVLAVLASLAAVLIPNVANAATPTCAAAGYTVTSHRPHPALGRSPGLPC